MNRTRQACKTGVSEVQDKTTKPVVNMKRFNVPKLLVGASCAVLLAGCKVSVEGEDGTTLNVSIPEQVESSQDSGTDNNADTNVDNATESPAQEPAESGNESGEASGNEAGENAGDENAKPVNDETGLEQAIRTGNPAFLPEDRAVIENAIVNYVSAEQNKHVQFFERIYGDQSVTLNPGRWTSLVYSTGLAESYPLVVGNKGQSLARAVEQDGRRSMAFGSNILRELNDGKHTEFAPAMENALAWLLKRANNEVSNTSRVAFALVDNGTFNRSKSWLDARFPNWEIVHCNDPASLLDCMTENSDLVITGSTQGENNIDTIQGSFAQLVEQQTPMLYVHLHSWNTSALTNTVLNYFPLSMPNPGSAGNYWSQDSASWDSYIEMLAKASDLSLVEELVTRLRDDSFTGQLENCKQGDSGLSEDCSVVPAYENEFKTAAEKISAAIKGFDSRAQDLFDQERFELEKMLVLLGDHYRKDIRYPMDKLATPRGQFLRALYADYSTQYVRIHNPVQTDLGNFSRSDFSDIMPVDKTLNYTSKPHFRSAGVYALPGQTFRVTRLDDSAVQTRVFVNSQRSGSTHLFDTNSYKRPKFLQSSKVEVKPGETIYLTSPYGGPVQVAYNQNELPVRLRFENVGEHPYWNGPEDDAAFDRALAQGDYDWAEVVTPGFEVHSTLEKMRKTVTDPNWTSGAALAEATRQYVHNYPHVLAGFKGPGIDVVPEIHDFAASKGWTVPFIDIVKHMNADQPTCGAGCSGNPYDAAWAFSPTGHGDIHELGHGLEKGRFKFNGREGHATTNFYSYFTKSKFEDETGNAASCQNLPFEAMFDVLKASLNSNDPAAYMANQSAFMNKWNSGVALMIQAMMLAQEQSDSLSDGWYMIPRLHLMNRELDKALKSDEAWAAQKDKLGFNTYSRSEAKSASNNDFLLLSFAQITGLNYAPFFALWGEPVSAKALAQVNSLELKAAVAKMYAPESRNAYCSSLDVPAFAVSNTSEWPHN